MLMRPDRWRGVLESPSSYYLADVPVASAPSVFAEYPRNLGSPAARAALATCPGQVAASFNRFLYAEAHPTPGGVTVFLWDARFGRSGSPRGIGVTPVELGPDLHPRDDARPCPEL
jgi:hypothetical protein